MVSGEMAHTKKTARAIYESSSEGDITFDFGLSKVVQSDLDDFVRDKWLPRSAVRVCEGEVKPNPRDDEVVVFNEFLKLACAGHRTRLLLVL